MNLSNIVQRIGEDFGSDIALRAGATTLSYKEMLLQSQRVAAVLARQGIHPGDRVALWLPSCIEYFPIAFAVWQVGAVVVPLNPLIPKSQVGHIIADSGTKLVIASSDDCDWLMASTPTITLGHHDKAVANLAELHREQPRLEIEPRRDHEDAMLMYTSGSTGKPKGVRQTHRNIVAEVNALIDVLEIKPNDIALNTMALFHVSGFQFGSLPLLFRGGEVVLMPKWSAQSWIDMVQEFKPTISTLITTMLIDVSNLTQPSSLQLKSLRHCMFGGSRTPPAALERFKIGTGLNPVDIYGTTETNGISITCGPSQQSRTGAAGLGLTQVVDFRLVPPGAMEPLPFGSNEIGELWVRGDTVTPGYWNLPEATAQKIVDGWLRSGDLMRQDEDGYFHYVDRLDDMIVSGGENVYPQGVEAILAASSLVAQVIVVGTPHPRWVQQVTAVIVPSSKDVTVDQIDEYCRNEPLLAGAHRPKRIELVEKLPRTGSGKIDRPEVKSMFARSAE